MEDGIAYPLYYSGKGELKRFFALEKYLRSLQEKESSDSNVLELILDVEKKMKECEIKRARMVNLIRISDGNKDHYCWIKGMSRLISSQKGKHNGALHVCYNCMNSPPTKESLMSHQRWCLENKQVALKFPKPTDRIKFKNHNRSMRVPFAIHADFESYLRRVHSCNPMSDKSYTDVKQHHKPMAFAYQIVGLSGEVYDEKVYIASNDEEVENIGLTFVREVEKDVRKICQDHKLKKPVVVMTEEEQRYRAETKCHICEKELDNDKVRDHCHLNGKYRGAAHNKCNLEYKVPKHYPIFFHNLSNYDAHLLIKSLGVDDGEINCIPNNEEKYIAFSKKILVDTFTGINKATGEPGEVKVYRKLRFLDSYKFMGSSLDKLTSNLKDEDRKQLRRGFSGEKLELVSRKGVFPYEWFDCLDKLDATRLPPKEEFWSELNLQHVSDQDYEHAQRVWNVFEMKTFREYLQLYLETDVDHLVDVFERFRDVCMQNYGLDPAWYYTAPGLSWDAMLKITKLELDPIVDPDMLMFFERQVREGVSMITTRHAEANNKYMKGYDEGKASSFIEYLDADNIYGYAMSQPLLVDKFKWMNFGQLDNWQNIRCVLEVDLEYPEELHDLHNDYPFSPERKEINGVEN